MAAKKSKSKDWYTILSPEMFGKSPIGKTTTSDPDTLVGKKINISAVEVTNNFSKYYMKFQFRISGMNSDKAYTDFAGSECVRDYISRMVLRHVRRIDVVQDLQTKDGVKIRMKGIAVVSKRAKSKTVKELRRRIAEIVRSAVEKSKLDETVEGIVTDKIKARVLREIRTIYPVRNFEFRKTEVLRE